MVLEPILALIIIRFLRKSLEKTGLLPKWNRHIAFATGVFISMIVLSVVFKNKQPALVFTWINHALMLALIYLAFTQKDFRAAKPTVYAFLPLISISFIEDVFKLINPSIERNWSNYFDLAELFALIWMGAMLYVNHRQRKQLEKERLKVEEKEKEFRITEKIKAELEIQVKERTAELTKQKEELQHALHELKSTQSQLIQSEKMASLGELTAGIAHEIQNPLNFVNNFSEINTELIDEMQEEIDKGNMDEAKSIANAIKENEQKIIFHGKRADSIVKGMLSHSRSSNGQKEPTDINALADEYLRLAFHGLRAKDKTFNATMKTDFDEKIGKINIIPQDMGRVILNLITNAFYAVTEKKNSLPVTTDHAPKYEPTVSVSTKKINNKVEITIKDNGNGIPQRIMDKIFQPFFTTKPTGQGTGLGLSMSYDIITKAHGGELKVTTKENEGATFIISLPV